MRRGNAETGRRRRRRTPSGGRRELAAVRALVSRATFIRLPDMLLEMLKPAWPWP